MPDLSLNRNADSDYLATSQRRDDLNTARTLVMQAEAADERGRAQILQANGLDPENYTRLKQIIGYPLNAEEAEKQRQSIEGAAPELQPTTGPVEGAIYAGMGAGPLIKGGMGVASAVGGSAAALEFQKKVGDLATKLFPEHPYAAQLAGNVIGALGLGMGSAALAKVGQGTPGETAPAAAPAEEAAPAGEAEAPAAVENAPPETGQAAETSPQFPIPAEEAGKRGFVYHGTQSYNIRSIAEKGLGAGWFTPKPAPGYGPPYLAVKGEDVPTMEPSNEPAEAGYPSASIFKRGPEKISPDKLFMADAEGNILGPINKLGSIAGPTPTQAEPAPPPAPPSAEAVASHSMEAMTAQAKATPMTAAQVAKLEVTGEGDHALLKTPVDALDTLRLHYYAGQKVSEVLEAARLAKDYGNQDAQSAFEKGVQELSDTVLPRWRAALHQAGLGLRVLGDPASAESGAIRDVQDGIRNSGGNIDRLVKALGSMDTVQERQSLLEAATATDWTAKGALYNLYLNSILSFNSAGKKLASDAANIIFQVPARGVAEIGSRGWETLTGQEYGSVGVKPGETIALTRGMYEGFHDALVYGLKSAAEGKPAFESDVGFIDNPMQTSLMAGSGFENTWWGRAIDLYGHMVSLPSRSIVGIDQFSKAMQYRMELGTLASRQGFIDAAGEGLDGAELSGRAAELGQQYLEKPADWMIDQSMKTAKINTFTQDLEGQLARFDAWRRGSYITRTLMPFARTPLNITLQGIRQSPLAPLSPTWRATVGEGGPEAALAMSKAALGSTVLGYLTYHVLQNRITGGIPENLTGTQRNDWLRDHQPYSIKIGDRWVSYQGLEPLSWLLGATADIAPAIAYQNNAEAGHTAYVLWSAGVKEFDRQPMWGALHQLAQAIDDSEKGKEAKLSQFIGRQAGAVIPSTIANFAGESDPVRRQTLTALDEIRNRIPWLKKNGLSTLDSFGDPVIVPPGFMWNEFPAYKAPTKGADPVVDKLIDLHNKQGFVPPEIPKALGGPADTDNPAAAPETLYGATLTPEEQHRWLELRGAGGNLHKAVEIALDDPRFSADQDPKGAKLANYLHGVFMAFQKKAEYELITERPEIKQRLMEAMATKKQAYQPRVAMGAP